MHDSENKIAGDDNLFSMFVDDEYIRNCRRHDENVYHFNRFLDHSYCYGYTLITQIRLQKDTAIRYVLCLLHDDWISGWGTYNYNEHELEAKNYDD